MTTIRERDAEVDDGSGFSVLPFVSVAEQDRRALLVAGDATIKALKALIEETYFPQHTPSSESGPEEWDVQLDAPSSETCEHGLRALAAWKAATG